ncbi:MAG: hypothetical protein HOC74_34035 [Gemmatimonadetes bacterium]|nr:hypothetical protein [Gemmatimonadota bacterium]
MALGLLLVYNGPAAADAQPSTAIHELQTQGGDDWEAALKVEKDIRKAVGKPPYETEAKGRAYGRLFWAFWGTRRIVGKYNIPELKAVLKKRIVKDSGVPNWEGLDHVQVFQSHSIDIIAYQNALRLVSAHPMIAHLIEGGGLSYFCLYPPATDDSKSWPWPSIISPPVVPSRYAESGSAGYFKLGKLKAGGGVLLESYARACSQRAAGKIWHARQSLVRCLGWADAAHDPDRARELFSHDLEEIQRDLLIEISCNDARERIFRALDSVARRDSNRELIQRIHDFQSSSGIAAFTDLVQYWADAYACSVAAAVDPRFACGAPGPGATVRDLVISKGDVISENGRLQMSLAVRLGNRSVEPPSVDYQIGCGGNTPWQTAADGVLSLPVEADGAMVRVQCPTSRQQCFRVKKRVAIVIEEAVDGQPAQAGAFARLLDSELVRAGFSAQRVASEEAIAEGDFDVVIRGSALTDQAYPNITSMYRAQVSLEVSRAGGQNWTPLTCQKRSDEEVNAVTAQKASFGRALGCLKDPLLQLLQTY